MTQAHAAATISTHRHRFDLALVVTTLCEVERLLPDAGFSLRSWAQTLARALAENGHIEPARPGRGEGAFVVVDAVRPS